MGDVHRFDLIQTQWSLAPIPGRAAPDVQRLEPGIVQERDHLGWDEETLVDVDRDGAAR